jgi:oligopeptide/dipeptide ABC transporter ATP-binding protein
MGSNRPIIEARNLKKVFKFGFFRKKEAILALDGVNLSVFPQQSFGLVGESGCGKTTLAKTLLALYRPTAGEVIYEGCNIFAYDQGHLERFRTQVQMIFQDPYGSLNPKMRVRHALAEVLMKHKQLKGKECTEVIFELLEQVGLNKNHADYYPHELSGGQRQRIAVTRALAVGPRVLICDEPVSALDMFTQVQIIELLKLLQQSKGLTLFSISHNMMFIKGLSRISAVMYKGRIVEQGPTENLFSKPLHPYTKLLMASIPNMNSAVSSSIFPVVSGLMPYAKSNRGCRYINRCPMSLQDCYEAQPNLNPVNATHLVACHLYH